MSFISTFLFVCPLALLLTGCRAHSLHRLGAGSGSPLLMIGSQHERLSWL